MALVTLRTSLRTTKHEKTTHVKKMQKATIIESGRRLKAPRRRGKNKPSRKTKTKEDRTRKSSTGAQAKTGTQGKRHELETNGKAKKNQELPRRRPEGANR